MIGAVSIAVATPAVAKEAACLHALGALAEGKLDGLVNDAWDACPCEENVPGADARTVRHRFGVCLKAVARRAVATHLMPAPCYSVLVRSARESTCGRSSAGAVTCCVPSAERCMVLAESGDPRCRAIPGAAIGHSPSCYDACPPVGETFCVLDASFDAIMEVAHRNAVNALTAAQGAPYDPQDAEQNAMLLFETPKHLPCFSGGGGTMRR